MPSTIYYIDGNQPTFSLGPNLFTDSSAIDSACSIGSSDFNDAADLTGTTSSDWDFDHTTNLITYIGGGSYTTPATFPTTLYLKLIASYSSGSSSHRYETSLLSSPGVNQAFNFEIRECPIYQPTGINANPPIFNADGSTNPTFEIATSDFTTEA